MKNKVFLWSLAAAFALNAFFFKAFRIDAPKVVSITESEVYLLENPGEWEAAGRDLSVESDKGSSQRSVPFFSLPGVYQKVYSPEMKHSIAALKEEKLFSDSEPFSEDEKITSRAMEVNPRLPLSRVVSGGKEEKEDSASLDKWISRVDQTKLRLSGSLRAYFDEAVLEKELIPQMASSKSISVQITFYGPGQLVVSPEDGEGCDRALLMRAFAKSLRKGIACPRTLRGTLNCGRGS